MSPNRLATETSPYLLQHAHNPVDWFAWGTEAFAEARRRDVPVLLSIGYAACHWCHVMAHESFEDPDTAAVMNEHFVNVKIDREERPDIDGIYMDAVQTLTGQGGWPMTVFCTADGVPFLGGTYFPPEDRHGMPSFKRVLASVTELWQSRREDLLNQGKELVRRIASQSPTASAEPLTAAMVTGAARRIASTHDAVNGGFGQAPKFPQAPVLEFLLRADRHTHDLREPLERTLRAMALGGIYDQLGGGFHRYSVDAAWLVPHFEKMLYDQAQLARVYLHAWQAYGDPLYRRICAETLDYLLRDMLDPAGAFHSSEDADSEGEEGRFYVWDHDDVPPEAREYYGLTPEGNFEGRTILTAAGDEPPVEVRARMLAERSERVRPGRDDKLLASWNGLAVAALAEAGSALGRRDLIDAARRAAAFVLDEMRASHGRLLHSWRGGEAKVTGLLEDVAYLADGLVELWQATFEPRWLAEAVALAEHALDAFADPAGGFHVTAADHEPLVVRQKDLIESATPSPAGVMTSVLQRLAVLLDRADLRKASVDALRVVHIFMDRAPQAVPTWLGALDLYLSTPTEVAFTGDVSSPEGRRLIETVTARYLPNRVLAGRSGTDAIYEQVALLRDKPSDGPPTAYVCEHYVCRRPTSDPAELAGQLG